MDFFLGGGFLQKVLMNSVTPMPHKLSFNKPMKMRMEKMSRADWRGKDINQ